MYTIPIPEDKICQNTRERIGEAIYLLAYFIRKANWETGRLSTSRITIARDTGFPEATVKRWMQVLCDAGEIATRRIPNGTLVTIRHYGPIARTRGVKYEPRPDEGPKVDPVGPPVDRQETASGPTVRPSADHQRTASGPNNIKRILSQSTIQNMIQNRDSLSVSDKGKGAPDPSGRSSKTPEGIFDYEPEFDRKLRLATEKISALSEHERSDLRRRALEEMASDFRPFIRVFVRRNDQGELEPCGDSGPDMLVVRMGEILGCK